MFVADDRQDARRFAERGFARFSERLRHEGRAVPSGSLDDLIAAFDTHLGNPQDVIASLAADRTLDRATDLVVQVLPVDPPHPLILRSLELLAHEVAPALGWLPGLADPVPLSAVG
jgi:alkanesulfonate monooxygenase SsuD/methylene tetrahydromethanopterin reductase-like flavin-dependent oxidoreductase (luciferase family)